MKKYYKFIEYAYLLVALFLLEEAVRTWDGQDASRSYVMIALAVMALFMYFFKRWFRKKYERENSNK